MEEKRREIIKEIKVEDDTFSFGRYLDSNLVDYNNHLYTSSSIQHLSSPSFSNYSCLSGYDPSLLHQTSYLHSIIFHHLGFLADLPFITIDHSPN